MGEKLANALIIFIIIVIIVLGGLYYVKTVGNYNISLGNIVLGEEIEGNAQTANANTVQTENDESRTTIGGVEGSSSIYGTQKGYKYNNRHYYNSLSQEAKIIYDAIANNVDNLTMGNYRISIDHDFSNVLSAPTGEQELKRYYDDAINAINLDIPTLFYLDFGKMFLTIETTTTLFSKSYKLYIDADKNPNYFTNDFTTSAQVSVAISQVESAKNQAKIGLTGSDYFKARKLHDWLISYMEYDSTNAQKASVYGALIDQKGVCESYARTYKYILDEIGIENILVTGTATNSTGQTEDHMWNYVKLDDKWYAVDVTWDDPIVIGGGTLSEQTKHKYFLKGSAEFFKNHTEKLTISQSGKIFSLPALSINDF